ncbi:MAG TPA: DNA-directed RNA polymerase subunit alpha C-terminal domain-containing protein [Aggregatilineales bacterium]|nr:DNA-directed RNA polymerase subunit alpha C-terminal domain-containing protein [Aggregatilineales bacterium]HPV06105.1 DNA-directed RNA polymerase subunit alpha C-terminal domain-containing protein [Aggregatilineales bacterium]HQA69393.1 DNA-directed RNA polymerase subunit alpha C-terminal domain-containing protein [Aggregatilineales bacterium]HQE19342.1 DNA-directed RNA polymerase subunit alpha C-terminal domain-containing protein [Aggregatilineales bacterium]
MIARETQQEAQASPEMPISNLELGARYEAALAEAGITTVADILRLMEEGGDEAITGIKGIGAKTLIDIKKGLRSLGFELPATSTAE